MNSKKLTLVLGASENTDRFSNRAIHKLVRHGNPVLAIGGREGKVGDVAIQTGKPAIEGVHTVTLYLNPERQKEYYDYILSLKPKRVVFNPGTENEELEALARQKRIETIEHCTLIMLDEGEF